MRTKCTNMTCPIVTEYGQICTTQLKNIEDMNNVKDTDYNIKYYEPRMSKDDKSYYCYNFGD